MYDVIFLEVYTGALPRRLTRV